MLAEGLKPEDTFSTFSFSGSHDQTALAVQAGTVDAGALNFLTWNKLVSTGRVDRKKVDVFWTTPDYVDYCWVASRTLPEALRARLRDAFLKLDPARAEDKVLLDLHGASGRVNRAPELGQEIIPREVDQPPAVLADVELDLLPVRRHGADRAGLVLRHQPAVADHVGGEDRGELAFRIRH